MHWFIDDERNPLCYDMRVLRNISECKEELNFYKWREIFWGSCCHDLKIDFISFDHDLGENQPTGYDILKMLINEYPELLSDNLHISVHSQNPIGKENILAYAENYKRVFGTNWRIER